MRILLLGAAGQLGRELAVSLAPLGELHLATRQGKAPPGLKALSVDLDLPVRLREVVREIRPHLLVNAAAFTAVDRAEDEPETAHQINAVAPGVLAEECLEQGTLLVHYSTDYVFSGESSRPWRETDPTVPLNIYGHSKLGGEEAIRLVGCPHLILRTGWVYGAHGNNFLATMLRLARERERLEIVADQTGAPTWTRSLAAATNAVLSRLVESPDPGAALDGRGGTYHLAASGETSWCDYARHIFRLARENGLIENVPEVTATTSEAFGARARRPVYSVLDSSRARDVFGITMPSWQDSVARCLADLAGKAP